MLNDPNQDTHGLGWQKIGNKKKCKEAGIVIFFNSYIFVVSIFQYF
jgi:hypothetical protein